ncbi:MAG: pyridoxamine 5'-phosphate oxidase family protein [Rhizobiaceae bacterium]
MEYLKTREELRQIYEDPGAKGKRKELSRLDAHARNFLARSPFVLIGTQDADGNADVTPKGDKPGFVAILDDLTIAIPDRPGNNRCDTLENLLVNPAIGLIFLIPGMNETLRINGEARITIDKDLRESLSVAGKAPQAVIVVKLRTHYMHCAKAFMRSELWEPSSWRPRAEMPTLGEILKDQMSLPESARETDIWLDEAYRASMW